MTQTKLQPLKRSRAFIFNFMWNAGFLFSALLPFTTGVRSDVLFSVTFPPSSCRTGIAFKGWSKFAAVRGDWLAEVLSLLHANTRPWRNDRACRSAQTWSLSLKSWIVTVVLQLNIGIAAAAPKAPWTLLWRSGLKDVYIWTSWSVSNIHTRTSLGVLRRRSSPVGLDLKTSVWALSSPELRPLI